MTEKKSDEGTLLPSALATCGIVMPISVIDNCTEAHWSDVQEILSDSIEDAGFAPNLVSNADDVGIIQKRIIQNLYENPVVVCDVSGKNPNVMFELGIRLAFDKPTIIVKDDRTTYSFDTAAIEHLEYPRDLRFAKIVEFKEQLSAKIKATHEKATTDKSYTTFLKHFGKFTVAKLDTQEVSKEDFILEELRSLRQAISAPSATHKPGASRPGGLVGLCLRECSQQTAKEVADKVLNLTKCTGFQIKLRPGVDGHFHLFFTPEAGFPGHAAVGIAKSIHPNSRLIPMKPGISQADSAVPVAS